MSLLQAQLLSRSSAALCHLRQKRAEAQSHAWQRVQVATRSSASAMTCLPIQGVLRRSARTAEGGTNTVGPDTVWHKKRELKASDRGSKEMTCMGVACLGKEKGPLTLIFFSRPPSCVRRWPMGRGPPPMWLWLVRPDGFARAGACVTSAS